MRGAWTAVRKILVSLACKTALNEAVKFDPRSRIRNLVSSNRSPRMRERLRACCAATIDEARVAVLAEAPELKWAHGRQASWLTYGLDHLKTECAALVTAASQIRASAVDAALRQLARRIAEATAEAAQARRAEGKLEFHDLLVLARDLLTDAGHGAAVRNALHQQYRRLLLDEFQDTDPIQIELAVRIAAGRAGDVSDWADVPVPPGSLFLVGDPKQSIYRFRRADIATYLRAQQRIGDPVILAANFRTTEPVLTWINHVFGQLISAEDGTQPAYIPLQACRPGTPAGPAVVVLGAGIHPGKPSAAELRAREAADVASSAPSTPTPPTATPTSSSPTTWKGSSPSCAARQPPQPWKNAGGCCACWSRTSSSARRRSPSATASRSGTGSKRRRPPRHNRHGG